MYPTSLQPSTLPQLARYALAGAAAVALFAGCGSKPNATAGQNNSAGKDQQVASITAPTSASSAPTGGGERPLIRPDTSEAEATRLQNLYQECLYANGAPRPKGGEGAPGAGPMQAVEGRGDSAAEAKAAQACADKEPEELWERSKRTNPHYGDKLHAWVVCAREHGIKAHESKDGFFSFDDTMPSGKKFDEFKECERKVFGG